MSATDHLVHANSVYVETFPGARPLRPKLALTIIECMDSRLDTFAALGLEIGDAHIIRNAGGVVTPDVIRSLLVSHYMLGAQEVMIINHTSCGMMSFTDEQLFTKVRQTTGTAAAGPEAIHTFTDIEENVRKQVEKVKSHPWIPDDMAVRGFVYDMETGKLREIV